VVAADGARVQDALAHREDLRRVDRLDQVAVDVAAQGRFHQALFFALGDHHHGNALIVFLDFLEGAQAVLAGHLFVEQDQVVGLGLDHGDGVVAVGRLFHHVAVLFHEHDVGPEELDFVIDPEQAFSVGGHGFFLMVFSGARGRTISNWVPTSFWLFST
jgi:hypothetical protein